MADSFTNIHQQQPVASTGTMTALVTDSQPITEETTRQQQGEIEPPSPGEGVLRLRGASSASSTRRRVQWTEEVVDNEFLGRKKTKICCIYHKPKEFGESSDEDSSDSSSSGEESDNGGEGSSNTRKEDRNNRRQHGHSGGHNHNHNHSTNGKRRKNAYEKQPHPHKGTQT